MHHLCIPDHCVENFEGIQIHDPYYLFTLHSPLSSVHLTVQPVSRIQVD